jgi:hypothetical protein
MNGKSILETKAIQLGKREEFGFISESHRRYINNQGRGHKREEMYTNVS